MKKVIVISVIALFILVGFQPAFANIMGNHPPNAPQIRGKGIIHELGTYNYKFNATDPDGDNVRYLILWGDSTSEWTDYYASGEEIIVSHTWNSFGDITIRARANDTHGALGPWGELIPWSISTEDNNEVKQETTVRIHNSNGVTPYTLKLTEKESDEVDRIFDNLKVSLDTAETGEEIDEIYDNAVESLYELGMFPKMTVEEAKQLVNGDSKKSQSGNIGTRGENHNCQISGTVSHCFMFMPGSLFRGLFLFTLILILKSGFSEFGWRRYYNFPYFEGKISSFSLGGYTDGVGYNYYTPSRGWVHTNGSNGVIKWEGEFYGGIEPLNTGYYERWKYADWLFIGIRSFEGVWNENNFLGNAKRVSLTYAEPTPPPPPWE